MWAIGKSKRRMLLRKEKNLFVAREARLPQRCLWQHTTSPWRAAAKCGCRRQGAPLPLRRRTMLLPFALAVQHHHPVDEERRATAPPLTVSSPEARCPRGSRAECSLVCVWCIGTLSHKATEKTRDPTNSGAEPSAVEALKIEVSTEESVTLLVVPVHVHQHLQ